MYHFFGFSTRSGESQWTSTLVDCQEHHLYVHGILLDKSKQQLNMFLFISICFENTSWKQQTCTLYSLNIKKSTIYLVPSKYYNLIQQKQLETSLKLHACKT